LVGEFAGGALDAFSQRSYSDRNSFIASVRLLPRMACHACHLLVRMKFSLSHYSNDQLKHRYGHVHAHTNTHTQHMCISQVTHTYGGGQSTLQSPSVTCLLSPYIFQRGHPFSRSRLSNGRRRILSFAVANFNSIS
jgi:hypothetical protein